MEKTWIVRISKRLLRVYLMLVILFQEDSESLMIEVVDKIKPFYQKYGLENTIFFLESILDGIHDVGGEYFGE